MKIGVFDSGIGGLTVLKEIIKKYPNGEYIYYGDTLHLPYGEKTKEELFDYSCQIIEFLINKGVDKIVIACGTVSSTIYNELSNKYNMEIINVIDCTVEKINKMNIDEIAVLATSKTIESHIFSKTLECNNVLEIACSKFVPFIEKKIGDEKEILDEYLSILKENNIKHIILGCTHYPLLQEPIKKYFNYPVTCYNIGKFVADTINIKEDKFRLTLYFSKIDNKLKENIESIIDFKYELLEV